MERLEGHGNQLISMLAGAPLGVGVVDTGGRYLWVNETLAAAHGITPQEHTGRLIEDVVPKLWPIIGPMIADVLAGNTIVNREIVEDNPSDPERPRRWLSSYHPIRDGDEIVAVGLIANDITDRHAAEQALTARNDLYAMLSQTTRAVILSESPAELFRRVCEIAVDSGHFVFAWIGVPDGKAVRVLTQAGEDGGYLQDLKDAGLMVSVDPDSPLSQGPTGRALLTGVRSVVNDISTSRLAAAWRDAVARVGWASSAAFPIRERGRVVAALTVYAGSPHFFTPELVDTLGELTPTLSVALDRFVSLQERAEREEQLALRDRALNAATQSVLICDMKAFDTPVIYASPSIERLTGYAPEELVGRNCRMLQGPDTDPETVDVLREALAARKPCTVEILNYRKTGEPFWNNLAISPVYDADGELTHFVGVQTDVTERRRLEFDLRQAQKMEAIGQLASGVAHDFNNVLTVIRGAVSVGLREHDADVDATVFGQIDTAAEHATRLTSQLLAFGRRQLLRPEATDLNVAVRATLELTGRLLRENISVEPRLQPGLPTALVDRGQLQQVLLNLVINAQDAMPDGGAITISTGAAELDRSDAARLTEVKPGSYLTIEITDTGVGMDEETTRQIFDPFFTTKEEGTGLGLATVYGILKQSGGHISVESSVGKGTTFRLYLPVSDAGANNEEPAANDEDDRRLSGSETILYVEDAELLRALVPRMLEPYGYTVMTAANAAEALEADRDSPSIDLLLSDSVMPGISGLELARVMQTRHPRLKVLLTSGHPGASPGRSDDQIETEFIQKPFLANELAAKIRSVLDGSPPGR